MSDKERQVDQEQSPQERARELVRLLVPGWPPTPAVVLWIIRIAIALSLLLGILALAEQFYGIKVLNLAQLLVTASIPIVIAVLGNRYTQQRAQDEALQAYLDKMTELLVVHKLGRPEEKVNVRIVAWAQTKTVLRRLKGKRKGAVLRFLNEAELIREGHPVIGKLGGAELVGADLEGSYLKEVSLKGVDLTEANLRGANLCGTDLGRSEETRRPTDLTRADLSDTDLSDAELSGAIVTEEQLEQAESLAGATMPDGVVLKSDDNPDGPTFEEWRKSREGEGE